MRLLLSLEILVLCSGWRRPRLFGVPRGGSGYDDVDGLPPPELPPYGNNPHDNYPYGRPPPLDPPPLPNIGLDGPPPLPDVPYETSDAPPHTYTEPVHLPPPEQPPWDSSPQDSLSSEDMSAFNKDYILRGLARLYRKKILPLELSSRYGHFQSPPLSPSDFAAPPMILLLGQYSVGKTSFVKYLLGRDFPGIRVGPEPTTDRFTAILWGSQDKVIPGAALCSQADRPFTGLSPFGNNFLSRMEAAELNAPILRNITIIDTPGILSGQKQRSRNYDYEAVMKWFAERSDLIIVMFDAHKVSWNGSAFGNVCFLRNWTNTFSARYIGRTQVGNATNDPTSRQNQNRFEQSGQYFYAAAHASIRSSHVEPGKSHEYARSQPSLLG